MQKNYYLILGITNSATMEEIKSAFRRRAQELHPDHSGLDSGPFLELQEAYGVLSDPEQRRAYDSHAQIHAKVRRRPWGPAPETMRRRPAAEPFRAPKSQIVRDLSLADSFDSYHPSFDELFDCLWSNFEEIGRPKAERLESLTLEVLVSAGEARRGGRVRVGIPGQATCPACAGRGAIGFAECWRCGGAGGFRMEYPVAITYPPGIRDGHVTRISLASLGIQNFYLTLVFRISGAD